MNHKELIITQSLDALEKGGTTVYPEAFEILFARIYDCGYHEAKREIQHQLAGINTTLEDMKETNDMLIAALKGSNCEPTK
jgi:hypothetical protein